ncbi:hypothetical protein FBU30_008020 [Linnemannia zychae]|nr:hypothetical protein FBU30_008020 [Linnemannia zychae]
MYSTITAQETKLFTTATVQEFCSKMKTLTEKRYQQALQYCGYIINTPNSSIFTDIKTTFGTDSTLAFAHSLEKASISSSSQSSLPCYQIYRNWHPEDLQRKEIRLSSSLRSNKRKESSLEIEDENDNQLTRMLLSYPAEKYHLKRDQDYSPIVNPYFNLLGLFFCATATAIKSEREFVDKEDAGTRKKKQQKRRSQPISEPVPTSPYGSTRYQVPFEELEQKLFPKFRLYFADFYQVVEDWYVQLIVVPSWNSRLEEQCRRQGLITLDVEDNPFFFRKVAVTDDNGDHAGAKNEENRCESREYSQSSEGISYDQIAKIRLDSALSHLSCDLDNSPRQNITDSHRDEQVDETTVLALTRHEYYVCSHPKLWIELFIGCDLIPTSELGETVESLLHRKVRKTANTFTIQQQRQQLTTILEGVSLDLLRMATQLREMTGNRAQMSEDNSEDGGSDDDATVVGMDHVLSDGKEEEEKENDNEINEEEMKQLLEITYRLSRDRTRMGILQPFAAVSFKL